MFSNFLDVKGNCTIKDCLQSNVPLIFVEIIIVSSISLIDKQVFAQLI